MQENKSQTTTESQPINEEEVRLKKCQELQNLLQLKQNIKKY